MKVIIKAEEIVLPRRFALIRLYRIRGRRKKLLSKFYAGMGRVKYRRRWRKALIFIYPSKVLPRGLGKRFYEIIDRGITRFNEYLRSILGEVVIDTPFCYAVIVKRKRRRLTRLHLIRRVLPDLKQYIERMTAKRYTITFQMHVRKLDLHYELRNILNVRLHRYRKEIKVR